MIRFANLSSILPVFIIGKIFVFIDNRQVWKPTVTVYNPKGYLGGAPDPGCEFTASTSPKKTEKRSKIILHNEYDESELSSVMINRNNFQLNKTTIFPFSFSFHPRSGPTKHLLKITFFVSFFFSNSTVSRKMVYLSFVKWKISRSR